MATRLGSLFTFRSTAIALTGIMLVLALTATTVPPSARADGDPASDVLLGANVFYPYMPPVSKAAQTALNAETAAAKHAGFPIKVALIASPIDLGVIPSLFDRPQKYADFLDAEISFQGKQPLLVVMPAGYGAQGIAAPAVSALSGLRRPAGKSSTALAEAATGAVAKLAAAAGHPIHPGAATNTAGGASTSSSTPIVIALALAAVVTAGALIVLRRRVRAGEPPPRRR